MTTRTLVILRHAKAERPNDAADIDRPLTGRGRADAAAAGQWLTANGYPPDLALVSPALRARETWTGTGLGAPAEYHQDLYFGGLDAAVARIRAVADTVGTLIVVGHNPTLSQLSLLLDPAGAELRTAGLAVHTLTGPWQLCGPRRAKLATAHTARARFSG